MRRKVREKRKNIRLQLEDGNIDLGDEIVPLVEFLVEQFEKARRVCFRTFLRDHWRRLGG